MPGQQYTPEVDASWGLIYRLNFLWAKVDRDALSGNHDKWELVLDRIFANLLYRDNIVIQTNGKDEVIKVSLSDKDKEVWEKLKGNIRDVKKNKMIALRKKDIAGFNKQKTEHYHAVLMYDIWLRKFMHQELKLYMREAENNPSMALFGGSFQKKGRNH